MVFAVVATIANLTQWSNKKMGKRMQKPILPLQELFDSAPTSKLGALPPEATFSTVEYCIEADDMPEFSDAIAVFKDVPAILLEIPVDVIKAASMAFPDMADSFANFDAYHRWYMGAGDMPIYGAEHRWPCIASLLEDELVQDGNHRLHAYIEAGHATIPVLRYDFKAWWKAHERWKQSMQRQHVAFNQNRERALA